MSCLSGVQTKTLPADFYTGAAFKYLDSSSNEINLPIQTTEQWRELPVKTIAASYPDRCYVDNFNILWLYPVQNQNITVNCYYQAVIADTVTNTTPALDSPWMIGLVYGVAAEIGDEYNIPQDKLARWEAKWAMQRTLGLQNEGAPLPDRVSVSD